VITSREQPTPSPTARPLVMAAGPPEEPEEPAELAFLSSLSDKKKRKLFK